MTPKTHLAGVSVGKSAPVRIMGVVNVSPESFYQGSVPRNERALARQVTQMEKEGADFIDVGAMSSAPYLETQVSELEEARRFRWAVKIIRKNSSLPISIDSFRSGPAEAGLEAGGKILNDITGLRGDPLMGKVAKHAKGVILMANPIPGPAGRGFRHPGESRDPGLKPAFKNKVYELDSGFRRNDGPVFQIIQILKQSLAIAKKNNIPSHRIVLDPGIGFFRNLKGIPWWKWDLLTLYHLRELEALKVPLLVGVSRKSFIGKITGAEKPQDRLAGSLAATAVAVVNGAAIIRTHDVKATLQTVRMAERLRIKPR